MSRKSSTLLLLVTIFLLLVLAISLPTFLDDQRSWERPAIQTTTPTPALVIGTPWWTQMPTPPGLGKSTPAPVTPTP